MRRRAPPGVNIEPTTSQNRQPIHAAHVDLSVKSATARIRKTYGAAEADELMRTHRVVSLNIWRPLRGPVLDVPLAIADARTLDVKNLVAAEVRYATRTGEECVLLSMSC